jgi:cysteine desulfurase family protein
MIYLDNAATTLQKPPGVKEAVARAMESVGNPSRGAHNPALIATRLVYGTRLRLAKLFGVSNPSRIAFTLNATDALNIAINGTLKEGDHVITTECEHNSVLRPLYLAEKRGVRLTVVKADRKGRINYEDIEAAVAEDIRAVVINHASNLTGNVTDLRRVAEITKRHGLLLIVDAAQTAGAIPIDVETMGIDILCFTGHKGLMGPQGTGGIYVKEGVNVAPLRVGGSGIHSYDKEHPSFMPEALEAGTLNCHGIAGLNEALKFIESVGVENIHKREIALAERFISGIKAVDGVTVYGDLEASERTAVVALNIDGVDSDIVCDELWENYEICTRSGAHCAPLMHKALGTSETGAVRFSFSYFNTEAEVDRAIWAVTELAGASL